MDTNVINILVKQRDYIFDQETIPNTLDATLALDVEALMHVFHVGARADWDILASAKTIDEISQTRNPCIREELLDYALQLVDSNSEEGAFATSFGRRLVDTHFVSSLPDFADRELIGNAIGFGCDAFCTCDRSTIIGKLELLQKLPIRILTPREWWAHVKPWAGLWC